MSRDFNLRRDNCPCRPDCPDRRIACSDYCRKPEYLAWKAEGLRIRQARQAYKKQSDEAFRHSEQRRKWE